jgi:hypothetical protein
MSEMFFEKTDARKLAHAYVALALAQDVAKRDLNDSAQAKRPLLSMLEMAADLLEEILQNAQPEECPTTLELMPNSDLVM